MKALSLGVIVLAAIAGLLLVRGAARGGGQTARVRPAAVAASFYPADPAQLGAAIDGYLAQAAPPPLENVVALVAPHAGYVYSGPVAAWSYALLKGRKFDRVVVLAPSHYDGFGFASVYDGTAFTTPFGQVPVDQAFAGKLARASSLIKLSSLGHSATTASPEHSVEVQLPFLQRVIGQFQVVPVVLGDQGYDIDRAVGAAVAKLAAGTNTLIVASSDLSHYHSYDRASTEDHKTLNAIAEFDYFNLARNLELRVWEACGGGPIVAAMIAAERLGATGARVLRYANTGDVTGDRSRVVGYGAVALVKDAPASQAAEQPFSLSAPEKEQLLKIARASVEYAVREHKPYECSTAGHPALEQERGAFVTLTEKGQLRGCIGYVAPTKPLYLTVSEVAAHAALRDSRFRPVAPEELSQLHYEISVLSPFRRVLDVKEIQLGQHGLLIHTSAAEGLLLPQVPVEEHWDRATFLEQVSLKAGLPARAWQDAAADLFRFTALVFGEPPELLPAAPPVPAPGIPARPARPF